MYSCFFAGEVRLPGPDEMADLYEVAVQVLSEAGLHRYAAHLPGLVSVGVRRHRRSRIGRN